MSAQKVCDRVWAGLAMGPAHTGTLAHCTGVCEQLIREYLEIWEKAGAVVRMGLVPHHTRGRYRVLWARVQQDRPTTWKG